jgi:16S rRNA (guanine966-N2)-methyltransferase
MARITGGTLRGRVLREDVAEGVRPTSDRVREALFSIVGQDLTGQYVLDAFGGTGLIGIEAFSRGARVLIVEKDRRAAKGIQTRAEAVGARRPLLEIRVGDVLAVAESAGPFDGIVCDPPYAMEPGPVFAALGALARSWFVYEADAKVTCPDHAGALPLDRVRKYGGSALWIYRPEGAPPDAAEGVGSDSAD